MTRPSAPYDENVRYAHSLYTSRLTLALLLLQCALVLFVPGLEDHAVPLWAL